MASIGGKGLMTRASRMRTKLQSALEASLLEIEDVSHQHAGHAAVKANPNAAAGETHFNLRIVSPKFQGQSLVKRHRMVYDALADELSSGLHAVSIVAKTPMEIEQRASNSK
ncbi:BolA-like [Parasponia andersonii]|uniref:BolA-like n=1 Tax=Parasponia andersonii TaxID=3476 RepID=A0A2P5BVB5_PARAD|nr:BolA-like [Parasponia andersonii]